MKRIVGKNNEKYYGDNMTLGLGETLSCFLKIQELLNLILMMHQFI